MLNKNDIVDIEITGMTDEGSGVGRVDGMVVFVPFSDTGDRLRVRVVKVQKTYCYGIIEEILSPSPDRIEVDCPVYRKCGGCAFRHISYDKELLLKRDIVAGHMSVIGGLDIPVLDTLPSPKISGYRNKAMYPVAPENIGISMGFYAKRSHRVIDFSSCLLQPESFGDILEAIRNFMLDYNVSAYDEAAHSGLVRHIYLRLAEATGQIMAVIVINGSSMPHSDELVKRILSACAQVKTVALDVNTKRTNVVLGGNIKPIYGDGYITDILCGVAVKLSPLSFYQVNHSGAEVLYGKAAELAGLSGSEIVLDLYCGAGTIGLSMAPRAGKIIGVDIVPKAIEDAKLNARQAGVTNAEFHCADVGDILNDKQFKADVIVLDPPRKGCEPQVLTAVAGISPEKIIMISCNSATLARDLKILSGLGYRPGSVQPVDMFPRTAHVECVTLMSRAKE